MNNNYFYINTKNLNHLWWYIDKLPPKETVFFWKQSMDTINASISVKSPFDSEPKRYIVFSDLLIDKVAELVDEEDEIFFINTQNTYSKKAEKKLFSDSKLSLLKVDFKGLQDSFFNSFNEEEKKNMRIFIEKYGEENPLRIKEFLADSDSVLLYNNVFDHRLGIELIKSFNTMKYMRYWHVLDVKTLYSFFYNANDMSIVGSYKVLNGVISKSGRQGAGMCPSLWYFFCLFMEVYGKQYKYSLKLSMKLFATWVYTSSNITNEKFKEGWKEWNGLYFFQPSDKSVRLFYELLG